MVHHSVDPIPYSVIILLIRFHTDLCIPCKVRTGSNIPRHASCHLQADPLAAHCATRIGMTWSLHDRWMALEGPTQSIIMLPSWLTVLRPDATMITSHPQLFIIVHTETRGRGASCRTPPGRQQPLLTYYQPERSSFALEPIPRRANQHLPKTFLRMTCSCPGPGSGSGSLSNVTVSIPSTPNDSRLGILITERPVGWSWKTCISRTHVTVMPSTDHALMSSWLVHDEGTERDTAILGI
jgi:hypothetical protein